MREVLEPVIHIVDTAKQGHGGFGHHPHRTAHSRRTDGAKLSYKGLPTPNLFAGGHNFHGPYEYTVLEIDAWAVDVVVRIIELYAQK
jgi:tripeptide aminopeptidase